MSVAQRLRLMALRFDAGLRETPGRFLPLAYAVVHRGKPATRRLLGFLVEQALDEASADKSCPAQLIELLAQAQIVLQHADGCDEGWRAQLAANILAAEPRRRRRRNVRSHGRVTQDRKLSLLRSLVPLREADLFRPPLLCFTIAYAIAEYETDHFVLQGPAACPSAASTG